MNQEKVCSLSQETINSTLTSVAVGISCVGPLGEKQGVRQTAAQLLSH